MQGGVSSGYLRVISSSTVIGSLRMDKFKQMKTIIVILLALIPACVPRTDRDVLRTEYKKYVLVAVHPPKRFYVDLVEVDTWVKLTYVYVSKHCDQWGRLRVGDTFTLKRITYIRGGRVVTDFSDLYTELCDYD
jgi:hypothetical protein